MSEGRWQEEGCLSRDPPGLQVTITSVFLQAHFILKSLEYHTMLQLLAAGSNAHGQLSNGSLDDAYQFTPASFDGSPEASLPPHTTEIDLAFGANHTLALVTQVESQSSTTCLWGCGLGSQGQLGPTIKQMGATPLFRSIKPEAPEIGGCSPRLIAAAWETSYVVFSRTSASDVLISMGGNDFGDLGVKLTPKTRNRSVHTISLDHLHVEDVSLGICRLQFDHIRAGPHHVVASIFATAPGGTTYSVVVGWGAARHGQLGGDGGTKQYDTLRLISQRPHNDRIIGIGVGNQHTVLLGAQGEAEMHGSNRKDQRGAAVTSLPNVLQVGCTWNGTYILSKQDDNVCISASGSNTHSQLGPMSRSSREVRISELLGPDVTINSLVCGSEHVLLWRRKLAGTGEDGMQHVWGWGWNEHGNLATGSTDDVPLPTKCFSINPKDHIVGVWAGCATSWIAVNRDTQER